MTQLARVMNDLSADEQLKVELMRAINADLTERFPSVQAAADAADTDWVQLYRVQRGLYAEVSIKWLLRLADRLNVNIRIRIERVP